MISHQSDTVPRIYQIDQSSKLLFLCTSEGRAPPCPGFHGRRHTIDSISVKFKFTYSCLLCVSNSACVLDMEPEKRKMYSDMKFQMEYIHNGNDQWQYTVLMPNGNTKTFAYKLGQEFDSYTLDGRPIIVSDTY